VSNQPPPPFKDVHAYWDEQIRSLQATVDSENRATIQRAEQAVLDEERAVGRVLASIDHLCSAPWEDEGWYRLRACPDDGAVPPLTRIGSLQMTLRFGTKRNTNVTLPAMAPILCRGGLFLTAKGTELGPYRRLLQSVALRILATMPPGRLRLRLIDPVGLGQNFTQLLQLPEAVQGPSVKHHGNQIDEELAKITEHISTTIQRKLTNRFPDIQAYNQRAAHDPEPYYLVLVSDFPAGFEHRTAERLLSIAENGPRAGVHVLLTLDALREVPHKFPIERLLATGVNVTNGKLGPPFLPSSTLIPDPLPDEQVMRSITKLQIDGAQRVQRIELPFAGLGTNELWLQSSQDGLTCTLGLNGTEPQLLQIGAKNGVVHHALVGGATRTGKSTLLHTLIISLCSTYSPEELQLYLVDFREGVEFAGYRHLPHARVVAIESEREFGISVLLGLRQEMSKRGAAFRVAGSDNLSDYREKSGSKCPRVVLLIDEFQMFFTRGDRIAAEARALLDDLVRRGAGFGIHLILCSQSVPVGDLESTTLAQLGIRIALRVHSQDESSRILARDNLAAWYLERQGQAIYNAHSGRPEGNRPFLVAYIPAEQRSQLVEQFAAKAKRLFSQSTRAPLVYEGNRPASVLTNTDLLIAAESPPLVLPRAIPLFLGEPVQMQDQHVRFALRRQSRSHLVVCGQDESTALAIFLSACASFIAYTPSSPGEPPRLLFINLSNQDSDVHARANVVTRLGGVLVGGRGQVKTFLARAHEEFKTRTAAKGQGLKTRAPWLVAIFGLQGASELQLQGNRATPEMEILSSLITGGSDVGLHLLIWANTHSKLLGSLDAHHVQEFEGRVVLRGGEAERLLGQPGQSIAIKPHSGLLWNQEASDESERFRCYGDTTEWIKQRESTHGTSDGRS